jgi:hypothetical protein
MTETSPTIDLDGDQIAIKVPTDGQLAALWRGVQTWRSDKTSVEAKMDAVILMEDIVFSLMVMDREQEDKLRTKLAMGQAELAPVVNVIFEAVKGSALEKAAPAKKAVRRGRPPKNAA